MMEYVTLGQGILERGLLFGLVVAGVYISSRIINFDNLAVEGAFGLGGALTAQLIVWDYNPWGSLLGSIIIGALSGFVTGVLHTKLRLNNLISGIVVTTGAFSIMLKIAGSNMPLYGKSTIFSMFSGSSFEYLFVLMPLIAILIFVVNWFINTEVGYLLKAVGDNPQMLWNLGKNVDNYKTLGLVLSNSLSALSGALFVQYLGYFSIWASVGVLVVGLAGLILAETLSNDFGYMLLVGAISYQIIISVTFELQIDQDWNKFITALLIVFLMIIKNKVIRKSEISC